MNGSRAATRRGPSEVLLSELGGYHLAIDAARVVRIEDPDTNPDKPSLDLADLWRIDLADHDTLDRRRLQLVGTSDGTPTARTVTTGTSLLFVSLEPDDAQPLPEFFTHLGQDLAVGGLIRRPGGPPALLLDVDRLLVRDPASSKNLPPEEPTRA